jgi:MFS family permease
MTTDGTLTASRAELPAPHVPLPGARLALILLLAINLFNYLDRQVLAAVEPDIRRSLFPDNPNHEDAKFWTGLLSTAFLVTYFVMAPIFGWLADHMSRWMLIGAGVIVWTLASGASGWDWGVNLALAYWLLLATRCCVGVGEAAYGPVAPTVIADFFPIKIRGSVMAWFYLAIPVGGALGYALGDTVARSTLFGGDEVAADRWRWAFYLVVPPGLLLGLLCALMRDPTPGQAENTLIAATHPVGLKEYLNLARIPSYVLDTLGMTAMTFALGGLAYWMPAYLEEVEAPPVFGVGAKTFFGGLTALSGLLATLLGGMAGDRLRGRFTGSYFLVSGAAMLLGFPMLVCVLNSSFPLAWIFVFLTVFCLFFNTGPTNTILANVTHPAVRASAFAFNIFIIHLFGDALSPPLIGYIAGHSPFGLKLGFLVVSLLMLVGGVIWIRGARYLDRDTELAPTRLHSV